MTQKNVDNGWFLKFKTRTLCDTAAPCNVAAYHNANDPKAPLVPCNKTAPISAPNCAYCCNFSANGSAGAYNEPIGGWYPGQAVNPKNNGSTRFGTNALGDGQLFWDFRNVDAQDYWAREVGLGGVSNPWVDGMFTDDPGGYGQEHPSVQSATQLSPNEIADLQRGTQAAWTNALALLTAAKKYIVQAYRIPPPFPSEDPAACASWMRQQCRVPANESTLVYGLGVPSGISAAVNMSIAAFLVVRGPYSYIGAPYVPRIPFSRFKFCSCCCEMTTRSYGAMTTRSDGAMCVSTILQYSRLSV